MAKEDIILAQRIVGIAESNLLSEEPFHNHSGIYLTSNEAMSAIQKYLNNREKILSVIASGDQILNCILGGTRYVDAFDISVFPRFFLDLKIAAVKALTQEEYVRFFFGSIGPEEIYNEMYDRIRVHLVGESLEFWDSLFDFYDWYDIIHSTLFSSESFQTARVRENNAYLQGDNYRLLRKMLDKVSIRTEQGNILDIHDKFKDRYDLIYLSNIIYYVEKAKYKELLSKFNLTDVGIILTYMYNRDHRIEEMFKNDKTEFKSVEGHSSRLMIVHR